MFDRINNFPLFQNPTTGTIPASLRRIVEDLLVPSGYAVDSIQRESESVEYGAVKFQMNGKTVFYRQAKTTPKKMASS